MSAREYRIRKGQHAEAAGYALAALVEMADDQALLHVESGADASEWAQQVLNEMTVRGYIEPKDQVQS